jgi:hypothetical protein
MDINAINRALHHRPHELTGFDCCGCVILIEAENGVLEFVCNECGAIVGSLHRVLLIALLQLEAARPVCALRTAERVHRVRRRAGCASRGVKTFVLWLPAVRLYSPAAVRPPII